MNIQLKLDDANWTTFLKMFSSAVSGADTFLKKAFLVVWPRESARHFEEEIGPGGRWEPWKASTRKQRIAHEIATTSARQRAVARSSFIRQGGKLLQISGKLRTQTTLDPEFVELPNGLKVISPTPYSGYLDEGTSKMVARPFMWLGDSSQDLLADVLIKGIWDKAGGDA